MPRTIDSGLELSAVVPEVLRSKPQFEMLRDSPLLSNVGDNAEILPE
jgi:hypothetical protein